MPDFSDIKTWVFDLDNTLYPPSCNLFAQVDERMTRYIQTLLDISFQAARKIQKEFYRDYGTTLCGLMDRYQIDPEEFLSFVHDIDYSWLAPNPALATVLSRLKGRKFIFTNGSRRHAEKALQQLGLDAAFEAIFDIKDAAYTPKSEPAAYEKFLADFDLEAKHAVMFEDLERNLLAPKALGLRTVLIVSESEPPRQAQAPVDFITNDLTQFLHSLELS